MYRPIGVFASESQVSLIFQHRVNAHIAHLAQSRDGFSFFVNGQPVYIASKDSEQYLLASHFLNNNNSCFIFQYQSAEKQLIIASLNNQTITPMSMIDCTHESGVIVSNYRYKDQHVLYFGERAIACAYSTDFLTWRAARDSPLLIDAQPLAVGGVWKTEHGILLLYFRKQTENGRVSHAAHLALFDLHAPDRILWKTSDPIWDQKDHWSTDTITRVGTVMFGNRLLSYWQVNEQMIYGVYLAGFTFDPASILRLKSKVTLQKHHANPIIKPNPLNEWESFNTFNPAAIYVDQKVHILYRAQGFDYISSVGYATSKDGITIDGRSDEPAFSPRMDFEQNTTGRIRVDLVSGGGVSGCEDPRITRIDDRIYMTYVAFDGWHPPRLALTSILLKNFLAQRWLWSRPVLISPPGIVDKSGCLFPEKIYGKYVFLHRVFPNILIDFVDDLSFDTGKWLRGQYAIKVRKNHWDSRKIGAGAPPIKTSDGWLLIYYGVDDRDASKYNIGAMLLDLADPTKVLYRTDTPILQPTEHYEWNGFKPGVAYPCGAVVIDDTLMVYYGAADSHVCVATAPLHDFIDHLKAKQSLHLTTIQIREITY